MSEYVALAAERLGIDALSAPERLPWLLAAAALALWLASRRPRRAVAWPALAEAVPGRAPRELAPPLGGALRALAFLLLALAVCAPVERIEGSPEPGYGLDIVLVVDTSGSMRALDTRIGNVPRTRLELAREVVARFARERASEGDRVGLIVFGKSAFTQCPLTSDGALLAAALERIEVGVAGEATALGDALALGVKRAGADPESSGRVVVLLTDGRSNAGIVPVRIALALAADSGVRVHTVGIGTGGGAVPVESASAAGTGLRFERHEPDPDTLRRISNTTGGRFFAARGSADLAAVYDAIDAFERVPRELPPRVREQARAQPLLASAGGLLLLELAVVRVWRRRLP